MLPALLLAVGAARSRAGRADGRGIAGGAWAVGAALSSMAGILALRYVLVVAGFSVPLLDGMPVPAYVPSVGEVMAALFVLGLAVGCYGLAVRPLPLERVGASEGEAQVESAYADVGADTASGAASGASPRDEVSTGKEVRDGGAA